MTEHFIGAALRPVAGTFDAGRMSAGEPGLPRQFHWGPRLVEVAAVLRTWKDTGPCRHGSEERYVRKHWFQVRTAEGETMTVYFERQARSGKLKSRWWLFTIDNVDKDAE